VAENKIHKYLDTVKQEPTQAMVMQQAPAKYTERHKHQRTKSQYKVAVTKYGGLLA